MASDGSDCEVEGGASAGGASAAATFDPGVVFAGWLKQKARTGVARGMKPWTRLYCVLYARNVGAGSAAHRLAFYDTVAESVFGAVPLNERMSVDLSCVHSVTASTAAKKGDCRFDVVVDEFSSATSSWSSRYPLAQRNFALEPHESESFAMGTRTLSLKASDAPQREAWVQALNSARSAASDELLPALISLVAEVGEGLDAEGLYRVSGDHDKAKSMLRAFRVGEHEALLSGDDSFADPLVIAGVLKLWLRAQGPILLPHDVCARCIEIGVDTTQARRSQRRDAEAENVRQLGDCLADLPVRNRYAVCARRAFHAGLKRPA